MSSSKAIEPESGRPQWSGLLVFLIVAAPLLVVYLFTAVWSAPFSLDAFANVQTGYEFGRHGDPFLSEEAAIGGIWSVPVGDEWVSHYPPGAALHVAPLFAIWSSEAKVITTSLLDEERVLRVPPMAPVAIVAAAVTAVAMGLVAVASNRIVPSLHAVGSGLVLGLGTGVRAVA